MNVKRILVTPDKHFPLHDKKALSVVCKAIEVIKPDAYVDLGDVGEWETVSHWRYKKKKRPPLEYQVEQADKEIKDVNKFLDTIDESLDKVNVKEKYLLQGNHDLWLDYFVEENPVMEDYLFVNKIKAKERNYKYYEAGQFLRLGKLYMYHGHHYGGTHHTRTHLMRLGTNVMYGHWHDVQQSSVTHIDGPKSAWSIGCLKNMDDKNNQWLGGRKNNWGHAFAIADVFDGGLFTVQVVNIIDGKCSINGKVIKG